MSLTPASERELLCTSLLKQVSRWFYLTLRVLPRAIRRQIGLAYLIARTTDTIADTGIIPVTQLLEALQRLRERILGVTRAALNVGNLAKEQGMPAMLRHYVTNILPNGYKAQVVAYSRLAAIRYFEALRAARDELLAEANALSPEDKALDDEALCQRAPVAPADVINALQAIGMSCRWIKEPAEPMEMT